MRSLILAALLLLAPAAHAGDELNAFVIGDWQLVSAIPGNMDDSAPNGIPNFRIHFGADGAMSLVMPDEVLTNASHSSKFRVEGEALFIDQEEGEPMVGKASLKGHDELRIAYANGMRWRLLRISADAIRKRKLAPESVEYLVKEPEQAVFAYDQDPHADLPLHKRLLGQWEVIELTRIPAGDFPPYGAFNNVWQFDGKTIKATERYNPRGYPPEAQPYFVGTDGTIFSPMAGGGREPVAVAFDQWNRLVIGNADGPQTILRRINARPADPVVLPPMRIVLAH